MPVLCKRMEVTYARDHPFPPHETSFRPATTVTTGNERRPSIEIASTTIERCVVTSLLCRYVGRSAKSFPKLAALKKLYEKHYSCRMHADRLALSDPNSSLPPAISFVSVRNSPSLG